MRNAMDYNISANNLHLENSYLIRKREFSWILARIKSDNPDSLVWKRSFASLKLEWACHNALYGLGIARERTKDSDLNYPQKWYTRVAYSVLGVLVWIFIK